MDPYEIDNINYRIRDQFRTGISLYYCHLHQFLVLSHRKIKTDLQSFFEINFTNCSQNSRTKPDKYRIIVPFFKNSLEIGSL